MKQVHQTRTGRDGNCTAACLASIFEVPIESVPDPAPLWVEGKVQEGHDLVNEWLAGKFGVRMMQVEAPIGGFPPGYWIATTDEGGVLHASVWYGENLVFDPSPNKKKLGQVQAINFFIVCDPSILFARGWLAGREAA